MMKFDVDSSAKDNPSAMGSAVRSIPLPELYSWIKNRPKLHGIAIFIVTAIAFGLGNSLFESILPSNDGWSIYWPHNAIALALLLIAEKKRWPWIVSGYTVASFLSGIAAHDKFGEMAISLPCNLFQILFSAHLLPRFHSLRRWMMEPYLALRFAVFAVLLGPALSSLPAAWHLSPTQGNFWLVMAKWALPDSLGTALWTPLVITMVSRETYDLFRIKALPQTLAFLTGLLAVSWLTFSQARYPLAFVPYPMLLFVALRLGFSGAVIGANLLSLIAAYCSVRGLGPFHMQTAGWTDQKEFILQAYSTLAVLFVFPLTVILVERRNFSDQLETALKKMERLATIDQLTGLANRRRFDETLDTEWRRAVRDATPISLLMIDADHFKSFNDHYGHIAGDDCLRGIAAALHAKPLRQHDLVARYGGEEFAAILPGAPIGIAQELAERMRLSVLELCVPHEGNALGCVSISIGCASFLPANGMTPGELIASADRALYLAKAGGRNQVSIAAPRLVETKTPRLCSGPPNLP